MMTGMVRGHEARIRVILRRQGREQAIDAIIDTGFTAWLTLPPAAIVALDLPWQGFDRCILADGSESLFRVFKAIIVWDGRPRRVSVYEANAEPLVGMALLRGYELKAQIRARGKVTVKRLPRSRKD